VAWKKVEEEYGGMKKILMYAKLVCEDSGSGVAFL